jgi:hypothetical protein
MNRDDQLVFCNRCTNKQFNSKKGIVCRLTGEHADFDIECSDYVEDEVAKKAEDRYEAAQNERVLKEETMGLNSFGVKDQKTASIIIISAGVLWLVVGLMFDRIFFYAFILIIVGFVLNIRAAKKSREEKFKDDSVMDNLDED